MIEPWNPWRALVEDHPAATLVQDVELPDGVWGYSSERAGGTIWLCKKLGPRQRNSTLAHELIHLERGILPGPLASRAKHAEEQIVRELTAQRLIPWDNLMEVAWANPAGDERVWAKQLWGVCRRDVMDRLCFLRDDEIALLPEAVARLWKPNPSWTEPSTAPVPGSG